MNCINKVKELPEGLTTQEIAAYFYLLARCYEEEGRIKSHVTTESLRRQFSLDHEQLEMVLDALYDKHVIEEDGGIVEVGYEVDKLIILYTEEESTAESLDHFSDLLIRADEFMLSARRAVSKNLSYDIKEALLELSKVKPAEFNTPQMLKLFKAVTELVMQEEYRTFDKSEAGSMKRLLTNLGGAKLVPLIVTYCTNFDKWGNYPNVLNLTKNKDAVYGSLKTIEKSEKLGDESFG